jgi:hypothetical protein
MLAAASWITSRPPLAGIFADLRYKVRTLRSSVGFIVAAVVTLAIGIGATTAVYSVVEGVLDYRGLDGVEQVYNCNVSQGFFRVLTHGRHSTALRAVRPHIRPTARADSDICIVANAIRCGSGHRRAPTKPQQRSGDDRRRVPANFDYLASSKMDLYAPKVVRPGERRIRNIAWYKIVAGLAPGSVARRRAA